MNPGKLNKRIKVLSFSGNDVEDEGGGFLDNWFDGPGWETVIETWASIRPISEKAMVIAQQLQSEVTHTIMVRYISLIKPSHVINFNNRRLNIETIRNFDESNTFLQLMCVENVQE